MPLSYNKILSSLDLDTQVTVTTVYLEMCRGLATDTSSEQFERTRHSIARCILRLAKQGERDASVLKAKVAETLNQRARR